MSMHCMFSFPPYIKVKAPCFWINRAMWIFDLFLLPACNEFAHPWPSALTCYQLSGFCEYLRPYPEPIRCYTTTQSQHVWDGPAVLGVPSSHSTNCSWVAWSTPSNSANICSSRSCYPLRVCSILGSTGCGWDLSAEIYYHNHARFYDWIYLVICWLWSQS